MKLYKLHEIEESTYIELFPGRLANGYMNEESIFIHENCFILLEPAIKRGYCQYKQYDFFVIHKSEWQRILNELEILKEFIFKMNETELRDYVLYYFKSITDRYLEDYREYNNDLAKLINELDVWIINKLKHNDYLTLIGV